MIRLTRPALTMALLVLPAVSFAAAGSVASWYDKLPAPPKTAAEAQARVRLENGSAQLDYPQIVTLRAQLEAERTALRAKAEQMEGQMETASAGMQADLSAAAGMDLSDPAVQEKLEKMSDAEKMAFAMRMSGQSQAAMTKTYAGGATYAGQESPAVQKAVAAYASYQQALGQQMSDPQYQQKSLDGMLLRQRDAHAQLDARLDQDAMGCAAVTSYEENKACLQAKSVACWNQHVALADQQIGEFSSAWKAQQARSRQLAADADRALSPVKYGEDARSILGKTQLYGYHASALDGADSLLKATEGAYLNGAKWALGKAQSQDGAYNALSGSCGFVAVYGRYSTNGGRSGTSRPTSAPVSDAARKAQDSAKKVLNWLNR